MSDQAAVTKESAPDDGGNEASSPLYEGSAEAAEGDVEEGNSISATVREGKESESASFQEAIPISESSPTDSTRDNTEPTEQETTSSKPEPKHSMQSMEIETQVTSEEQSGNDTDESFEGDEDDMEHLLGETTPGSQKDTLHQKKQLLCMLCVRPEKVGNMRIFLPTVFKKTRWGIAGPHWFGPICVLLLLSFASHYFIGISERRIGPITTAICILFTLASTYNLVNVAYRDPGVVKLQPSSQRPQNTDEDQRLQYRWCDRCQIFQPVDGAHCSDCNVCIAGFDRKYSTVTKREACRAVASAKH